VVSVVIWIAFVLQRKNISIIFYAFANDDSYHYYSRVSEDREQMWLWRSHNAVKGGRDEHVGKHH